MVSVITCAIGGFLLVLAGIVYAAFATWLAFCRSLARLPNGDAFLQQAPKIIEAFDVRGWGTALLPWRLIECLIRWAIRLISRSNQPQPPIGP